MNAKPYVVRSVIVVDRPALRGASYPVVAAGTTIVDVARFESQGAAIGWAQMTLSGQFDTSGEYVRKVEVYQERRNASPRTVRKAVDRSILGAARAQRSVSRDPELRITAIAVGAARRGNTVQRMAVDWPVDFWSRRWKDLE